MDAPAQLNSALARPRWTTPDGPARDVVVIGAAGTLAAVVTVIAGGQVGPVRGTSTLTSWLGLLAGAHDASTGRVWPGVLQAVGIAGLVTAWLAVIAQVRRGRVAPRTVWKLAAWWGAPFLIGPPLLSSDVYSYAAQGALLDRGLNPYEVGPAALINGDALRAVDPVWQNAVSPYGPLTGVMEHLAASVGVTALGTVVMLRLIAAASAVVIGLCAVELAGPEHRAAALAFTVLNPLVLLQVVSAAHLEGLMGALLLLALVIHRRSPTLALVAACAAAAVKAPAAVAIVLLCALRWRSLPGRQIWTEAARAAAVVGSCAIAISVLTPNGWGWLGALGTPAVGFTRGSPTALLGGLLRTLIPWAPYADITAASRFTGLLAAACIVAYLAVTADRRPLTRSVGYGLLAVAILGPIIYPWYLLWGLLCLAPTVQSRHELRIVVATSAFACFMGLTGLNHVTVLVSDVLLIVAGVGTAAWWWWSSLRDTHSQQLRRRWRQFVVDARHPVREAFHR